jgi:hypothetical protein
MWKAIGAVVGCLVVILAITWLVQGNDFFMYKVFAPQYADAQREVFENSKSYNQGMIQELQNLQVDYVKATPEQKDALASIILHRTADFDVNKLPSDLRKFIEQLRRERTEPQSNGKQEVK